MWPHFAKFLSRSGNSFLTAIGTTSWGWWEQRNAMQVWETREEYRTLVERGDDIRRYLKPSEIAEVFNVERYLAHVDEIFERVFGE